MAAEMRNVCCTQTDRPLELAELLLGDLIEQFEHCEIPHCRSHLSPGRTPAADNCCEGGCPGKRSGQLTVNVSRVYPSVQFPRPSTDPQRCRVDTWAVELLVTSFRCAHTMNDDGTAPTPAQLTADTRKAMKDAQVIRATMECAFASHLDECDDFIPGEQSFIGPSGGCIGVTQSVIVRAGCGNPCDPLPEPE